MADVQFISDASSVNADATASAGGSAFGEGDSGGGKVAAHASTSARGVSVNAGEDGSASFGISSAAARFVGSTRSVTSVTSAPVTTTSTNVTTTRDGDATVTTTTNVTTTSTTTTRTEISAFESLAAYASNFQSVQTLFASPSSAEMVFDGDIAAAFSGSAFTRILSTPVTRTTTVADTTVTKTTPAGATTTDARTVTHNTAVGPTTVKTVARLPSDPSNALAGQVSAEASVNSDSDYTFSALGGPVTVTVQYATDAAPGAPLDYNLELFDGTTQTLVDEANGIGANAAGTIAWSLPSPGTYSLIASEVSDIYAYDGGGETQAASLATLSHGLFDVSIAVDPSAAVPELSTMLMTVVGFGGIGTLAMSRVRIAAASRRPSSRRPPGRTS